MEVLLHPRTQAALGALARRPAGSYLFQGPRSVGKAAAARGLTRQLICDGTHQGNAPACPSCHQLDAGTYPDLEMLKPGPKPSISIEQVRTLIDHLSRRPYYQNKIRVAMVDDAERLTIDATNALLKIVEEPPDQTIFILITDQPEALLDTIRSRCSTVHFVVPAPAAVSSYLEKRYNLTPAAAANIVTATPMPGLAITAASDPAAIEAHTQLAQDAAACLQPNLFNRLLLASKLAAAADVAKFARLLHAQILRELQSVSGAPIASRQLQAVERFRRHQAAGLAPKVALERLMLEL